MRRFLVFAGEAYYPQGGLKDVVGSFDTLDDAVAHVQNNVNYEWWHIFDLESLLCVMKSKEEAYARSGFWTNELLANAPVETTG